MNERSKLHALTRRSALGLSAGGIAALACAAPSSAGTQERSDLNSVFTDNGVAGTFVLLDPNLDYFVLVNAARAKTRFIPASTFEIANSIIALETGVVKDENEIIPYGGKPQPFKQWENDLSMREAIALSAVPIYQELARRIGLKRYREWLPRLDFGNGETGAVVDRFWLDGPLKVSAVEEARFVARLALGGAQRLAQGSLNASLRSQQIIRDILRLEGRNGNVLYGTTGWCTFTNPNIGWWTGWVENSRNDITTFSLNIDMPGAASDVPKRVAIGKTLLKELGIFY
jgi:beta-lactamase class D